MKIIVINDNFIIVQCSKMFYTILLFQYIYCYNNMNENKNNLHNDIYIIILQYGLPCYINNCNFHIQAKFRVINNDFVIIRIIIKN